MTKKTSRHASRIPLEKELEAKRLVAAGATGRQVAEVLGISKTVVAKYAKGKSQPAAAGYVPTTWRERTLAKADGEKAAQMGRPEHDCPHDESEIALRCAWKMGYHEYPDRLEWVARANAAQAARDAQKESQ